MKPIEGKVEFLQRLGIGARAVGNDLHVSLMCLRTGKWVYFVLASNPTYRRIREYFRAHHSAWLR